jgi:hypothetical protein
MKQDWTWITLSKESAFGYSLPKSHLLHSLLETDTLLLQRITTQAASLGKFLVDILLLNPIFSYFFILPLATIGLHFIAATDHWAFSTSLLTVLGISYALALLLSIWRQRLFSSFKAFRERLQYVGEKTLMLDFKRGELQIKEHLEHAPQRDLWLVFTLNQLRTRVHIHLHDPDSDVDFYDEMRIHLVVPQDPRVPDWARSKLQEPIYIDTFDNTRERSREITEISVQNVLDLLQRRLNHAAPSIRSGVRRKIKIAQQH